RLCRQGYAPMPFFARSPPGFARGESCTPMGIDGHDATGLLASPSRFGLGQFHRELIPEFGFARQPTRLFRALPIPPSPRETNLFPALPFGPRCGKATIVRGRRVVLKGGLNCPRPRPCRHSRRASAGNDHWRFVVGAYDEIEFGSRRCIVVSMGIRRQN